MTAGTPNKLSPTGNTAAFRAVRRAETTQRRRGRIAGRLAAFYDLVSGPAMTAQERTRAELADIRNAQARTLYG